MSSFFIHLYTLYTNEMNVWVLSFEQVFFTFNNKFSFIIIFSEVFEFISNSCNHKRISFRVCDVETFFVHLNHFFWRFFKVNLWPLDLWVRISNKSLLEKKLEMLFIQRHRERWLKLKSYHISWIWRWPMTHRLPFELHFPLALSNGR